METSHSEIEPIWLFLGQFNANGVLYMVTGATAAILYGTPRLTNDLDIVLELSRSSAGQLPALFPAAAFYLPPPEVVEIERSRPNRGHFNIIHMQTGYKADRYLAGSDPLHAWGLAHRRSVSLDRGSVSLAPPEYVILRKLEFFAEGGSQKHLQDIQAILRTTQAELDDSFLQHEISQRGLSSAWQAAQKQP
jgi:hypothetical protein